MTTHRKNTNILIIAVIVLVSCQEDDSKEAVEVSADIVNTECRDGASRMFPDPGPAKNEKFVRCMIKNLGQEWRVEYPELPHE